MDTLNIFQGRMEVNTCKDFVKKRQITNSRYNYTHSIYTIGDEDQFNFARSKVSLKPKCLPNFESNMFKNLSSENIWEKFQNINSRSTYNSFLYLFHKFKKGIFVKISNNRLESFIPFSNAKYTNEFSSLIKVTPNKYRTVDDFLKQLSQLQKYPVQRIKPLNEWCANDALLRYDYNDGDNNVVIIYDLLKTLCEQRNIPDIEFFINRRDFPQFTKNETEPYTNIFGDNVQLKSHNYSSYAPILSFSGNDNYADIIIPTYEDWARAVYQETKLVFPNACREYPEIKNIVDWNDKIEKAVFRGSSTGVGVSNGNDGKPGPLNQRLVALRLAQTNQSKLDVGITKWNLRPRKLKNVQYLQTISYPTTSTYQPSRKLSLQEQSKYKYILCLEGNVAAYRLSYELSSGSVVLLADSEWKTWLSKLLVPYVHYVPINADLSNLITQIDWCKNNDKKCRQIAENALNFYNTYLNTAGILDFLQKQLWDVNGFTGVYSYLPSLESLVNEEKDLMMKKLNEEWKINTVLFPVNVPITPRCIGLLDGMVSRMRTVTLNDQNKIERIKQLFKNVNGTVSLYKTANFFVVGKKATTKRKVLEHIHENYIGINAINPLLSKIPNFSYVYGPLKDAQDMVFAEYIKGITMIEWLQSPSYNFKDFISILIQLNMALKVAQNTNGFIHNDLYPWNVMITTCEQLNKSDIKNNFTYVLNPDVILGIQPEIIPIMIDYGKSRVIVYEGDEVGLIDRGFSNLFRHSSILDTLTILYGSLSVLENTSKLGELELDLLKFPARIGLPSYRNIKRWAKFGALFDFVSEPNCPKINTENANPKHFIDFVLTTIDKSFTPFISFKTPSESFKYTMEDGIHQLVLKNYLETGNKFFALQSFIKHVNYSRIPTTRKDLLLSAIQANLIRRRLDWVDKEIKASVPILVQQWTIVQKSFEHLLQFSTNIQFPHYKLPTIKHVYFNEEVSPEEARCLLQEPDFTDWITIFSSCLDIYIFKVLQNPQLNNFIRIDMFELLNTIAANNTLNKMITV